jgi:hypothetical protein
MGRNRKPNKKKERGHDFVFPAAVLIYFSSETDMTHALCFYSYNDRKRKGAVIALTLPVISGRALFFRTGAGPA